MPGTPTASGLVMAATKPSIVPARFAKISGVTANGAVSRPSQLVNSSVVASKCKKNPPPASPED